MEEPDSWTREPHIHIDLELKRRSMLLPPVRVQLANGEEVTLAQSPTGTLFSEEVVP